MTAYNIKKSHRVFLFGKGDSRISLENFKNKMIKLNEYFIIGDEYQNNFYTVGNITSNDLVIFCTYSAMHHDYNSYLPVLKDHNVPIITVYSVIPAGAAMERPGSIKINGLFTSWDAQNPLITFATASM